MNTTNQPLDRFLTLSDRVLDPRSREQVASLIRRADALFNLAAKAWETGNNSGDGDKLALGEARCDRLRREAEALLRPLGIKCSYPGLYPSFTVNGFDEHETRAAVLVALGHPRSFILAREI